jgi:hypothetical protein
MSPEIDYDLTLNQWEALKALRVTNRRALNKSEVNSLVALQLVEIADGSPVITAKGRSVLLRGSPRLWDVAA